MKTLKLISVALIVAVCGCSTIRKPQIYSYDTVQSIRTAYVVKHDKSTRNVEIYIQKALVRKGIEASYGPLSEKPDSVDVYITYVDRWNWDGVMYLRSLSVSVYDNKTDELLATGKYKNFWRFLIRTFPNPNRKTQQVVDSIIVRTE